ncbi:unnamed protein product [Caenorhabditis brenneri]
MAHRMNISQFGRQYPQEATRRCYEPSAYGANNYLPQFGQQLNQYGNCTEWNQPPSWADVTTSENRSMRSANASRQYPEPPKKFPQVATWGQAPAEQQSKDNDVFSTMGHWVPARPANRYQQPLATSTPIPKEDVFKNIGEWKPEMARQSLTTPMTIDLSAPTPLPTFPTYPNHRTNSFDSATTSPTISLSSSEEKEKNSWKTIEAMINPSRSPSVAEEVDIFFPNANPDSLWTSNLY